LHCVNILYIIISIIIPFRRLKLFSENLPNPQPPNEEEKKIEKEGQLGRIWGKAKTMRKYWKTTRKPCLK